MYVALTYVDTGKRIYAPGEIVEDDPNAEWHLKINAIRPMAEEPAPRQTQAAPEETPEEAPEEFDTPAEEEAEAEEAFEEPEAPEIDVTAALVSEPDKPKATTRQRKGGKGK